MTKLHSRIILKLIVVKITHRYPTFMDLRCWVRNCDPLLYRNEHQQPKKPCYLRTQTDPSEHCKQLIGTTITFDANDAIINQNTSTVLGEHGQRNSGNTCLRWKPTKILTHQTCTYGDHRKMAEEIVVFQAKPSDAAFGEEATLLLFQQ